MSLVEKEVPTPLQRAELEKARDVAVRAAVQAAELIRYRAATIQHSNVRFKGKNDLVTEVDVISQNLIISVLREAFPTDAILAEEEGAGHDDVVSGRQWIIDPVDGTTNFIHGISPYAVSIGLRAEGRMVVGVVLEVTRNEIFSAYRGDGLRINGVRAGVSETPDLANSLITTGFPYREFQNVDAYLAVMREFMQRAQGLRRPGSAATDLAWVAAGRFDAFFETGLSPWDVAAGILLVEEGGGTVTDFKGGSDPVFGGNVIASNGIVHEEMMSVVEPLREAMG
jgi:myo-inositol-1(or 4)-monophosphatase